MEIKNFLIDLDGTMFIGDTLIDGAMEFFTWLRETKKRFRFITNNSSVSTLDHVHKLQRLGITCSDDSVFSSTKATISYLNQNGITRVYPLGTAAFLGELAQAKFYLYLFADNHDCVIVAFDKTLTYEKANHALMLVRRGAKFIATHPDLVCPTEFGFDIDCGSILAMMEAASGRKALILGKPSSVFIDLVLSEMGADREETLIVGDRVYTDMAMGINAGIKTCLVLSGETKDACQAPNGVTYIVNNVGEIPKLVGG